MKFFKTKPLPAVPVKSPNGFFTEDGNKILQKNYSLRIAEAIKKSVQIDPSHFKTVDSNGDDFALDENIQQVKQLQTAGGYLPIHQIEWYAGQGFIGWQMCAIIAQNWLVDKCMSIPAKDAIRNGWEIKINEEDAEEEIETIKKFDKLFKIKKNCIEFIKFGKIFGIRHALFLVDGIDYEKPFNIDGVKEGSYRGITQIDPYWITPELDQSAAGDPSAQDFYEPTWWRVNGKRIHRSHFVIMRNGDDVADFLKPTYFYGGIPTTQKIYERIYAAERTANEAPLLAMTKRMVTLKIDTAQAMLDPQNFATKMQEWSSLMNNMGIKVIGGDEEVGMLDTSLASLDETIMTQYQLVAAAASIPATKLLETSPKGFNATGEYEQTSYNEDLESLQENEIHDLLERHTRLVLKSACNKDNLDFEIVFNPLDVLSAEQLAEINLKKSQSDSELMATGAIDGQDIRTRLSGDADSGYFGLEKEKTDEEEIVY